MAGISMTKMVAASPDVVFDVLTDHRGYEGFFPLTKVELEAEGSPHPNGVGAVRVFKVGSVQRGLREEVLEYDAPTRFAYSIVSKVPLLRSHRGDVTVSKAPGGSKIEYRMDAEIGAVPNFAIKAGLRAAMMAIVSGIRREAERRAKAEAA